MGGAVGKVMRQKNSAPEDSIKWQKIANSNRESVCVVAT
jgi:hypothetical protein